MAEHPAARRLVVMAPPQRVRLEPSEPHGQWCQGILRQGMPQCHHSILAMSALWECHPSGC